MKAKVEVLDCGFEDLAGNTYNNASFLSVEAGLSELKDGKDNVIAMVAQPHTLFATACLFVSGTAVREGNLEKIRFKVSNFGV